MIRTAFAVFAACLALGVAAGIGIGATRFAGGDGGFADMTQHPIDGADKAFNWLIFSLFTCTGIISATMIWVGGQRSR